MLTVIDATQPDHWNDVRQLCWEYRELLLNLSSEDAAIVRTFYPKGKYSAIMASLESDYARPEGSVKLLLRDGHPLGCAMTKRIFDDAAELKRVFVRPEAQGLGAGRLLVEAMIAQCMIDGYDRILLDTGKPLKSAIALYEKLGFIRRGPYQDVPEIALERIMFFELTLH